MLAPGMIRKMGKTYTDRQMTKDNRVLYQDNAWAIEFIAFKEPPPKHIDLERDNVEESAGLWERLESDVKLFETQVQVWPVEIRPIASGDESKFATGSYLGDSGKRLVRLSDGNGLDVWLNAGYVGAILKRCSTATFHVGYRNTVIAKNGRPFAMVMPMVGLDGILQDSPWSIVNDDLDGAREFDTANELMALLPGRPGRKWHSIFYMGTMLEVRRSGCKGKERALHVRMVGREATASISLYDGRGVKDG